MLTVDPSRALRHQGCRERSQPVGDVRHELLPSTEPLGPDGGIRLPTIASTGGGRCSIRPPASIPGGTGPSTSTSPMTAPSRWRTSKPSDVMRVCRRCPIRDRRGFDSAKDHSFDPERPARAGVLVRGLRSGRASSMSMSLTTSRELSSSPMSTTWLTARWRRGSWRSLTESRSAPGEYGTASTTSGPTLDWPSRRVEHHRAVRRADAGQRQLLPASSARRGLRADGYQSSCHWWGLQATKGIYQTRRATCEPVPRTDSMDDCAVGAWSIASSRITSTTSRCVSFFVVYRNPVIDDPEFRRYLGSVTAQSRRSATSSRSTRSGSRTG